MLVDGIDARRFDESERRIRQTVDELRGQVTMVMVAHRESTLE